MAHRALSGLVIACLLVGLVLMFQIHRLGDLVMENRTHFQTHPDFTTEWCDMNGRWHRVTTVRKPDQTREDWMSDAKLDLDASIAGFGQPMSPQPKSPESR